MDILKMTVEQALEFTVNHTRGSTFSPDSWNAKAAMLVMANEIESFRQQLAEKTSGEPELYRVGNWYETKSGNLVQYIRDKAHCIECSDGLHRYNRHGDVGRVTGSPHDFSHQENFVHLYKAPPSVEVLLEALRKLAKYPSTPKDEMTSWTMRNLASDALNAYSSKAKD